MLSSMKLLGLIALVALSACSSPGPGAEISERDPYESLNRPVHNVNLFFDGNLIRPVAKGYDATTPEVLQGVVSNASDHLNSIGDIANYSIQGDVDNALTTFGRFLINTVLGAGGLLDPATEFGLAKADTDFGVTLGKIGVGEGAYLVLPFVGPTTTRDVLGRLVDETAFDPLFYAGRLLDSTTADLSLRGANALELANSRAQNADLIDDVLYKSADSYISLRSIYLQRRDVMIRGPDAANNLPDIFADEDPS